MNKSIYYFLNFTWGIIMTVIGFLAAAVLTCVGKKATMFNGCLWFTVGERWGGVSLGLVIITGKETSIATLRHEYGHSIQNAMYGILFPFIVGIPSMMRYWKRKILASKGVALEPYDAIWFEGQATSLGNKFAGGL